MSFGSIVYTFFIKPLQLLFELIFSIANRLTANPGVSIIFLSLAVNVLVFPLYRRADEMQHEERNLDKKLQPRVDQIKNTFTGDERFMILQAYYRQNNYKPINALKGSLSLLLEIPFFIAAYNFLSGLQLLKGTHFGPIPDLGAPDALISFQGIVINALPVLMTIINIISASIYMKGFPLRDKIQTYGMAVIFLFFLYNSPSGLVFYWTLNNVFSLIKNILYKLPDPKNVLTLSAAIVGIVGILLVGFFQPFDSVKKHLFVYGFCCLLFLPLIISRLTQRKSIITIREAGKTDTFLFTMGSIYLTLVSGILIPSSIIKTSPGEFINLLELYNPLWYVLSALLIASGTFLLWFGIYYRLASLQGKNILTLFMIILSFCSTVNYMFFGTKRGDMSADLIYFVLPSDTAKDYIINIMILITVCLMVFLLWKKKKKFLSALILPMCMAVLIMSFANIAELNKELTEIKAMVTNENYVEWPQITLSKKGKNVVILMMDRSIGYFMPFLLEEKPELREQFSGFTYYPQTISFATKTNGGLPAIYGGYEYIPEKMNERSEQKLVEKHNEALLMMPKLFGNANYKVTILNPTYANYKTPSDLSIYNNIENVSAYNLDGRFGSHEQQEKGREARRRNFFCHSIYKMSPLILQPSLYTCGSYNEADLIAGQIVHTILTAAGTRSDFEEQYNTLKNLSIITHIEEDDLNTFTTLDNSTTHNPTLLQMPDYIPADSVDNTPYEKNPVVRKSINNETRVFETIDQITHYQVNMAAYLMLGKWFDYLRQNEVFDNTRIIIVADHGQAMGFSDFKFGEPGWADSLYFNPILMVKDFNSTSFTIDDQLMTNADVPLIAMKDLIDAPVNPATGKSLSDDIKYAPEIHVYRVGEWNPKYNNGFTFAEGDWAAFYGGDIYDPGNWKPIDKR